MLTAIIATHESERILVPTLAALVPGATAGLITEVIVADANSRDATAEVADIAGCRLMASGDALGERLKQAAISARAPWLLFLRAGTVPDPGWVAAVERFIGDTDRDSDGMVAAAFRPAPAGGMNRSALSDLLAALRALAGGVPKPEQGLLIARRLYDRLGGHPDGGGAEAALLRLLGRRGIATLSASAVSRVRPIT